MTTETLPMPTLLPGTDSKSNAKIAPLWNVIIINDDYHTFEFVIYMLITIFKHDLRKAYAITKSVHETGRGIAATCSKERAELYVEQVTSMKEDEVRGAIRVEMEPAE